MLRQLWLFPHPRPLVERFGAAFFRSIPKSPGVYYFCGPDEGVLYVGKARNLRRRLGTYRVADPERLPRRMIRLLHRVTRIEWDECGSELAAEAREELLIAVLQPKFNRAGKVWPIPDSARQSWLEARQRLIEERERAETSRVEDATTQPLPRGRSRKSRRRQGENIAESAGNAAGLETAVTGSCLGPFPS